MQGLKQQLQSVGAIGGFILAVVGLLSANWATAISVAFGLWVGFSDWALHIAPRVQLGITAFIAALWTLVGIVYLRDRKKPTVITPFQDYRYGLTYEGLSGGYNPGREEAALQIGIHLRNYSPGPLTYKIERVEIRIDTRVVPRPRGNAFMPITMPRGAGRFTRDLPFRREHIADYTGRIVEGSVHFTISYGHPESEPTRKLIMELGVTFDLTREGQLGLADAIIAERDVPIDAPER